MAIFHCYVSLPEGKRPINRLFAPPPGGLGEGLAAGSFELRGPSAAAAAARPAPPGAHRDAHGAAPNGGLSEDLRGAGALRHGEAQADLEGNEGEGVEGWDGMRRLQ